VVYVYVEKFKIGASVRVAEKPFLEDFRTRWKWHHPLQEEQVGCAGAVSKVKTVGFYHGGDVIYTLEGLPGIWHEECLNAV